MTPFERTLRGYRSASSAERATFGILGAFAASIGIARADNYVRERRRTAPRLREFARWPYPSPGRTRLQVHHYLSGIALALAAGGAAILSRDDGRELWFGVPFGVGAGLTLDEVVLLVQVDNPYWESRTVAFAQAGAAAAGAAALAARFYLRGGGLPSEDGDGRPA